MTDKIIIGIILLLCIPGKCNAAAAILQREVQRFHFQIEVNVVCDITS